MKQTIEYYYNIKIEKLMIEHNNYHFIIDSKDYYFIEYLRSKDELEDIINCNNELKKYNIPIHEIIFNIKGSALTEIEGKSFILLKVNNKDTKYDIIDLLEFSKKVKLSTKRLALYRNNWGILWSQKIDYIENQLNEISIASIIHKSIDYYIGLSETAIYYVNLINEKYSLSLNDKITLSHKRIYYPNYSLNYLNPLSFIFDLEVRDIAEYLKSIFFNNEDAILELEKYLKSIKLTPYSYNMLYARLLYPTYYWDIYEKVVNQKDDNQKLLPIIEKSDAYQAFLKEAYILISKYAPLEKIDYIIY